MSRFVLMTAVAATLAVATGCSESRRRDHCADVADLCAEDGETRCSRESDAIEVCAIDLNGCMVWTPDATCGGPGTCVVEDGTPLCSCDDECDEGSGRCRGDVMERCEQSDAGCWYWAEQEDCGERDMTCDDSADPPSCASGCADACDRGARRCEGRMVQECAEGAEGCTEWADRLDCGDDFCVEEEGDAFCQGSCEDQCDGEGLDSCDGDVVVTCVRDDAGCLLEQRVEDCRESGLICVELPDGVGCDCPDVCAPDETRCNGDTVQACVLGEGGCWVWDDRVDCAALGLPCDDSSGVAGCDTGGGDGCDDALVVWDFPEILSGGGFAADFTDSQTFTHDSCLQHPDSPEVIFAIDVEEDGILYMSERVSGREGGVDVTFSVQSACDPDGECLFAQDRGEGDGFYYAPETPGRYYVIVEAVGNVFGGYEIILEILYPEDCGNGEDDDLNGRTDCDDPECFGDPTFCATETNCGDGEDNDADGDRDCDDSDCSSLPACGDILGVWELFGEGDLPDVAGSAITFTPDAAAAEGYTWSVTSDVTDFTVEPGSGTATSTLTLGDDDVALWPLGEMGAFSFYGIDYSEVYVGSNGFVTFGAEDTSWNDFLNNHFNQPGVSGFRVDLNPTAGGAITVDERADAFAVTYEDVPRYGSSETVTFQIVLHADGSIVITFLASTMSEGLVGIASGVGRGDYPPETDFVIPPPEDCSDGVDNDFDGAVDCGDDDCFGVAPCDVENLCDDGLDNDGDGAVDCDDDDCAGPACEPYRGYWERFETRDEPDVEGWTITFTPDDADPQGYTWERSRIGGGGGFPVAPGSGETSTDLLLGDDEFQEVAFSEMAAFDFYGITYSAVFVSSNGFVTFGEGDAGPANDPWDHFALPSIAGYRRDLYEVDDDRLVVDEFSDHVAVTWEHAAGYAGPNDFQIVLWDTGVIELHFVEIPVRWRVTGLLGISNGVGNGEWPAETDFVP